MTDSRKISIGGIKKGRNEGLKSVTANSVLDGAVVYLARDGRWTGLLAEAAIYEGNKALAALDFATGQEGLVVGPYLMDVNNPEEIEPAGRTALREQIRKAGPTVPSDYSGIGV